MPGRRGMTLVEMLVSLAILSLGIAVLLEGFSAGRREVARMDVLICGRWLAQSVLESVLDQVANRDNRHFKLGTPAPEILLGSISGRWKKPFEELARPRTRLVEADGTPGAFFEVATGPAWPASVGAPEVAFWQGFSYEVRVDFTASQEPGGPATALDADGDGRPETDLARLEVEVFWAPEDGSAPERSTCHLTTLVGAPDKPPGIGALVDE